MQLMSVKSRQIVRIVNRPISYTFFFLYDFLSAV